MYISFFWAGKEFKKDNNTVQRETQGMLRKIMEIIHFQCEKMYAYSHFRREKRRYPPVWANSKPELNKLTIIY